VTFQAKFFFKIAFGLLVNTSNFSIQVVISFFCGDFSTFFKIFVNLKVEKYNIDIFFL